MENKIKERRDEKLNNFILKCLRDRPLSSSQILERIGTENKKATEPKFKVNTLPGLRKDHLKYLEDNSFIFRLDKESNILNISAEDFMASFWKDKLEEGRWERISDRNYFHAYYFAIPRTYKIKTEIFDAIIREQILGKFGEEYIREREEIEKLLIMAERIMAVIEIFPNINEGYKGFSLHNNFIQYITDILCGGKGRKACEINDGALVPILEKIENLFFFGGDDSSKKEVDIYRILRRKLSEKGLAELPKEYEKQVSAKKSGLMLQMMLDMKKSKREKRIKEYTEAIEKSEI